MDELLTQFLVEGRDLVAEAQSALSILADEPANAVAIDSAFRAAHTLKGSVAIFAMEPAERVLHAAEELLERARKHGTPLAAAEIARLVATLDQVDRWIDEIDATGVLGSSAPTLASRLLGPHERAAHGRSPDDNGPGDHPAWAAALEGPAAASGAGDATLTAFRYVPDGEALFRGDDPVNLVATIPDLVSLAITPADGKWPEPAAIDPFRCQMIIEGLSAAPRAEVQAIFRLVSDQVRFHDVAAAAGAVAGTAPSATLLRVDAARLDALADATGELTVSVNGLSQIADRVDGVDRELGLAIRGAQAELERRVGKIRQSIAAVRLVSLAPTLRRLPRLVREVADELGKQVDFKISGEHAEVDKQIADGLYEPLLHLVRNALDHGIEPPEARIAAGKSSTGQLALSIMREGDDIVVRLGDDGAGIDPMRIRAVAVARGVIDHDAADRLTDAAAIDLIFAPGFSTAAEVSGISGRGVGMDAVKASIDRLGGRIEIESRPGAGAQFALRLPANALTTRLLVVQVGPDRYAVPFGQIVETARVEGDRLLPIGAGTACVLRERTIPVLSLAALLGGTETAALPAKLLVTQAGGEPVALRVDGFGERIDAMVRQPAGLLADIPSIGGTTLLGDGGVMLVLNLPELLA